MIEELIDISSSIVQVVFRPRPLRKGGVFDSKTMKPISDRTNLFRKVQLRSETVQRSEFSARRSKSDVGSCDYLDTRVGHVIV